MDNKEILRTREVPEDIKCKDCRHRNKGQQYPEYRKANCGIYREGVANKPVKVLDGGDCEYYEKE